jgi:hypothetical protein
MLKAIAVLFSLALIPQGVPPAGTPQGSAGLSGMVARVDNDKPVPGALVQLQRQPVSRDSLPLMTRTDEAGAYRFEKVPAGNYVLLVSAAHHFATDAVPGRPAGQGKRLEFTEGQQIEKFDLQLVPASAVEGQVLDEFGDPAPGVTMMVSQLIQMMGKSRLVPLARTAVSDDRGTFRIANLSPGDYYLLALSGPFGTQGGAMLSMPVDTRAGFAPTYFPGTGNAVDAKPLRVAIGRDSVGLSFAMVPSRLFTVSGRVSDATGASPAGAVQLLQTQGGDVRALVPANMTVRANGTFVYRNVPQGSYVLQARSARGFGTSVVSVHDRDVTDVAIVLQPPRTASGIVRFEGAAPPPKDAVRIEVWPVDVVSSPAGGNAMPRVRMNNDYTFELPGLQSLGVLAAHAPPAWQLRRVTLGGEDITGKPYDFRQRDVSDLEVVLSDRWASVVATVTDVAGNIAADCTVIVFSQDATKWTWPTRYVTLGRTNQQGVFKAPALPGGAYLAVAIPTGITASAEVDPVVLESLRAAAARLTLTEGAESPVALKLIR